MLGRSRNPSPGGDGSPHGLEVTSMDYEGGDGSPRGLEITSMDYKVGVRRGNSFRNDGFSLVASDEELVGNGRSGSSAIGGSGSGSGGGGHLDDGRQHLSSDSRTFVNLLISFVGAGILGIPFAFRQVGGGGVGRRLGARRDGSAVRGRRVGGLGGW
eukprot:jgi/Undpi1/2108/HiC_scaffold_12.g05494.m1